MNHKTTRAIPQYHEMILWWYCGLLLLRLCSYGLLLVVLLLKSCAISSYPWLHVFSLVVLCYYRCGPKTMWVYSYGFVVFWSHGLMTSWSHHLMVSCSHRFMVLCHGELMSSWSHPHIFQRDEPRWWTHLYESKRVSSNILSNNTGVLFSLPRWGLLPYSNTSLIFRFCCLAVGVL